jgi:hypothetical protein
MGIKMLDAIMARTHCCRNCFLFFKKDVPNKMKNGEQMNNKSPLKTNIPQGLSFGVWGIGFELKTTGTRKTP